MPKRLFAIVQDAAYFNTGGGFNATVLNGVYRTSNGPTGPWTRVADSAELAADPGSAMDPDKIGPGYAPGVQAWYNQHIEVDPTNPDHVTLGLEEIYESVDGGQEWDTIGRYWNFCFANPPWPESPWCNAGPGTEENTLTTHPDQHDAAYTSTGDYFAGSDGGMYFQSGPDFDNDSWVNLNRTISTIQCYYGDIAADGTMLCGTQDNGTAKFTGGAEWPVVTGGDGGDVAIEPDASQNMWAEYVGMTMFASSDGGVTWAVVPPPDDNPRFISPFEMDPLDPQHVVAGGQELWDTTLGVATTSDDWVQLFDLGFPRQTTAISLRGSDTYAAWCGPCNPSSFTPGTPFAAGLVSNVGRDLPRAGRRRAPEPVHHVDPRGPGGREPPLGDGLRVLAPVDPGGRDRPRVRVDGRGRDLHRHLGGPAGHPGERHRRRRRQPGRGDGRRRVRERRRLVERVRGRPPAGERARPRAPAGREPADGHDPRPRGLAPRRERLGRSSGWAPRAPTPMSPREPMDG